MSLHNTIHTYMHITQSYCTGTVSKKEADALVAIVDKDDASEEEEEDEEEEEEDDEDEDDESSSSEEDSEEDEDSDLPPAEIARRKVIKRIMVNKCVIIMC